MALSPRNDDLFKARGYWIEVRPTVASTVRRRCVHEDEGELLYKYTLTAAAVAR